MLGLSSDSTEQLRKLRDKHELPFTFLSDPMLLSGEHLDVPISSRTGYLSALALHPVLRHLPRKAYLQPAVLVWKGTDPVYGWRQSEGALNLLGASGRPSAQVILKRAREALG